MHDDDFDTPIPDFDDLLTEFDALVVGIAEWADKTRDAFADMLASLTDEDPPEDGTGGVSVTVYPPPDDGSGGMARIVPVTTQTFDRRHIGPTVEPMTSIPFDADAARARAASAGWES